MGQRQIRRQVIAIPVKKRLIFSQRFLNRVCSWEIASQEVQVLLSQGIEEPYGISADNKGGCYIANKFHNRILYHNAQGQTQEVATKDSNKERLSRYSTQERDYPVSPTGIYFDKESNSLLATFSDDHTLYEISPEGILKHIVGRCSLQGRRRKAYQATVPFSQRKKISLATPTQLLRHPDEGSILFIERGNQVIRKFHPETGLTSVFSPESSPCHPTDLALLNNDTILIADYQSSSIREFSLSQQLFTSEIPLPKEAPPVGLSICSDKILWVLCQGGNKITSFEKKHSNWQQLPYSWQEQQQEISPEFFKPGGMGIACLEHTN